MRDKLCLNYTIIRFPSSFSNGWATIKRQIRRNARISLIKRGAFQKYVSTYFTPTLKSMWIACLNRVRKVLKCTYEEGVFSCGEITRVGLQFVSPSGIRNIGRRLDFFFGSLAGLGNTQSSGKRKGIVKVEHLRRLFYEGRFQKYTPTYLTPTPKSMRIACLNHGMQSFEMHPIL